jgi:hypothetical protein
LKKLFFYLLLLSGCTITSGPGFYSGYNKMDVAAKSNVVFVTDGMDIGQLKNDQKIYAITANHLLKCLEKNDTSIVYFWSPNCHGQSCVLLKLAQNLCDSKNHKLYVITEYYDMPKISPQNVTTFPILSINHKYYGTDHCNKYCKLFTKELIRNKSLSKEESYQRFYVFVNDKFLCTKTNL